MVEQAFNQRHADPNALGAAFARDHDQKDHALSHAGNVVRAGEAVNWHRIGRRISSASRRCVISRRGLQAMMHDAMGVEVTARQLSLFKGRRQRSPVA